MARDYSNFHCTKIWDKDMIDNEPPVIIHDNGIFSVIKQGRSHFIQYNVCAEGAVVVPRLANGDFVMVRLKRVPVFGSSLEFPRGGVDHGERPIAGALRELREETGYLVPEECATRLGSIGADTGAMNHISHVFLVDIPEDCMPGAFDEQEIDSCERHSLAQLKEMISNGVVFDGHTIAALGLIFARMP